MTVLMGDPPTRSRDCSRKKKEDAIGEVGLADAQLLFRVTQLLLPPEDAERRGG